MCMGEGVSEGAVRARVRVVGAERDARVQTQTRTQKMRSRWCLHTNVRVRRGRG